MNSDSEQTPAPTKLLGHVATLRIREMGALPDEPPEKLEIHVDGIIHKQHDDEFKNSAYATSCPVPEIRAPMPIFISVQPPISTRQLEALHPPLEVQFLHATDLENVSVFASLYRRDGTLVNRLLVGTMRGVYSDGKLLFSDLRISEEGDFRIRITARREYTCLGSVDSRIISVTE